MKMIHLFHTQERSFGGARRKTERERERERERNESEREKVQERDPSMNE
jgi:hypothetical protein